MAKVVDGKIEFTTHEDAYFMPPQPVPARIITRREAREIKAQATKKVQVINGRIIFSEVKQSLGSLKERLQPKPEPEPKTIPRAQYRKKKESRKLASIFGYWGWLVAVTVLSALAVRYFFFNQYVVPTESMLKTLIPGERVVILGLPLQYLSTALYRSRAIVLPLFIVCIVAFVGSAYVIRQAEKKGLSNMILGLAAVTALLLIPTFGFPVQNLDNENIQRGDVIVFHDKYGWLKGKDKNTGQLVKRVIGVPGDKIRIDKIGVYLNDKYLYEPYALWEGKVTEYKRSEPIPPGKLFVLGDNRGNSADSRTHLRDGNGGLVDYSQVIGKVRWKLPSFQEVR